MQWLWIHSNPSGNDVSTGEVTVNYVREIPFDLRLIRLTLFARSPMYKFPDLANALKTSHNLRVQGTIATLLTAATLLAAKDQRL